MQKNFILLRLGENLTKWEYKELNKEIKIATGRLEEELQELNKPYKSAYSKAQMGSLEYRNILAQIRNLKNLEIKKRNRVYKT